MVTLLEAQKTINATPYVTCTVGGTSVGHVARYKYWEKANSPGRCSVWLDNSGGRFDDLATDWTNIKRGKEVIISRGLTVGGVNLSQALPTVWVETIMFVYFQDMPYLVLDCIDWIGRLRYFRFSSTQTYTAQLVSSIVSTLLSQVGLTLSGSITSLTIDYEIKPTKSAWSAILELMAKVPEVLYASTGKVVAAKELDASASASYTFAFNPAAGSGHPILDDTDVAEATALYNTITVVGGPNLEYSATVADSDEVTLIGYARRKYITDRRLSSAAECTQRATAELEQWTARATAGVIVARPHFTVKLYDVVSAPAPPWGGPAVGSGHVTRIVEWYNFGSRKYDQALTLGEVPDAALLHLDDTGLDPLPIGDTDPGDPVGGTPPTTDPLITGDDIGDGVIDTQHLADGAVGTAQLADNSITQAKMQNDSIGTAEIIDGNVTTDKLAADSVTASKIDSSVAGAGLGQDGNGALIVNVTSPVVISSDSVAVNAASTSAAGVVELATNAETVTGTDATRAVTPDGLSAVLETDVGIGAAHASPAGLLHGYDTISGFLHWEFNGLNATTRTIIANGTGDVTACATVMFAIKSSGSGSGPDFQGGVLSMEVNDTALLYDDTDGTVELRTTAGGALEVQRTAGTSTFKVSLWVIWI